MSPASEPPRPPRAERFGRSMRLRSGAEFDAVFAAKQRSRSGPLLVFGRPNGGPLARLGLSVGRAVGGSVARHRVKRLLREAFRTTRVDLPSGFDFLVVIRPHAFLRLEEYREHLRRAAAGVARAWSRASPPDAPTRPERSS